MRLTTFVLALYAAHGLTASDFLFSADVDRDLLTGRKNVGGVDSPA